jgi:ribonucleoside-triphosphate reductase
VAGEQALDYFNIFLAPFVRGVEREQIREDLRLFLFDLNQSLTPEGASLNVSLGLELVVPSFIQEKEAIGSCAKVAGSYADFVDESRLLLSLLLEVMLEETLCKPLFSPNLIVKIRAEAVENKECASLLFEAHRLAAERGLPFFANLLPEEQRCASYTAMGLCLSDNWKGDWELDTIRTGSIDNVIVNLPRLIYEAEGNKTELLRLLDEQLEMALRALEIKYRTLKQRCREGLLQFLTRKAGGDQYFRLENSLRLVSPVGLNEASKSFIGKFLHEDEGALKFAEEIMRYFSDFIRKYARKPETRPALAMVPNPFAAKRLAKLDVERYGWANVNAQGTREQPFYTDMVAASLEAELPWRERLKIEEKFHKLAPGSHLAVLPLADTEQQDPEELLATTKELATIYEIGLYTFNRKLAYCGRCHKVFSGQPIKCPSCGSVDALAHYQRVSAKYESIKPPI